LNRIGKTAVKGIGAKKIKVCITRSAQALGTLSPVLKGFDEDNGTCYLTFNNPTYILHANLKRTL